ncbi:hypothetical protein HB779_02065 [Phyllobacterium sp. 628]|uniref:hypothetical protein n=1 Tax=Phyllobacterium sp. 628 TaxID=2718938 RepID=UPI0016622B3D|nr:hypothetical protein [Phyllobacterium sp. 628]QND50807.1 hypothetical protein HB779_02065 [Phyllobacterium sp. 628]
MSNNCPPVLDDMRQLRDELIKSLASMPLAKGTSRTLAAESLQFANQTISLIENVDKIHSDLARLKEGVAKLNSDIDRIEIWEKARLQTTTVRQ